MKNFYEPLTKGSVFVVTVFVYVVIYALMSVYSGASFMYCWNNIVSTIFGAKTLSLVHATIFYGIMSGFIFIPSTMLLNKQKRDFESDSDFKQRKITTFLFPALLAGTTFLVKLFNLI